MMLLNKELDRMGRMGGVRGDRRQKGEGGGLAGRPNGGLTLSQVLPLMTVRVIGFLPGLSAERRSQLQSYGIMPGYRVRVIQQKPVTVIEIEHLEVALERELANKIQVTNG